MEEIKVYHIEDGVDGGSSNISETVSIRGMMRAVPIPLEDYLLPPIDPEEKAEWKRLRDDQTSNKKN
ncbi:hypothetical protein KC950_00590 [Candidatus Saccharibacteria bacterium]|nr:hypothetical protein [Candidatus Saccharibacteria bacterium]